MKDARRFSALAVTLMASLLIFTAVSGNPAMLKGGSWGGFLMNQIQFVAGTIISSILIAYVWFKTGGSVWAAILTHNVGNEFAVGLTLFTKSSVQIAGMTFDADTPFKIAIAALIVATTGTQLGRREAKPTIASDA